MIDQTLYLGDAYELIKQFDNKSIDLIVCDPPYDIQGIHGSGIMKSRNKGNFSREIEESNLDKGYNMSILDEFIRVLKHINIYVWCNKSQIYDYLTYFVKERKCNWEMIVWRKENAIPFCGTHYLVDKEYCLYFWEQGADVFIPFERAHTLYTSKTNVLDKAEWLHPCCKPVSILTNFILNSSLEGGVVLDPFAGSCSTGVACKNTNRNFIGFEINEKWYQIGCDRLNGINAKGEVKLLDI